MNTDPLDVDRYRWAVRDLDLPTLDDDQVQALDERARVYRDWVRRHRRLHNVITVLVIGGLVVADLAVALVARQLSAVAAVALVTAIHGYLTYSATIYTMHEGAGHGLLVLGRSRSARRLNRVLSQTCRLFFADPEHYASVHPSHHSQLATVDDMAYTHYVAPARFLRSLLPLAGLLPFNDYVIHTDHSFSRSHVRSLVTGALYHALLAAIVLPATGVIGAVVTFVLLAPWWAFTLDRVRETYDHLFSPDNRRWGARSLGLGLVGMLFGGGPWGQPCHLSHHFAPWLPWYMQLRFHLDFRRVLRPDQQATYLSPRWSSFARTYARNLALMREGAAAPTRAGRPAAP